MLSRPPATTSVLAEMGELGMSNVALDVTKADSIKAYYEEVAKITGGKLDILINNALHPYPLNTPESPTPQIYVLSHQTWTCRSSSWARISWIHRSEWGASFFHVFLYSTGYLLGFLPTLRRSFAVIFFLMSVLLGLQ